MIQTMINQIFSRLPVHCANMPVNFETAGKVITCKAPICWGPTKGQTIEEIQVEPPQEREVRVKIRANGICRSDAHHLDGHSCDVKLKYPTIFGHEASGIVESIGHGVTSVVPGDHVVMLFMPNCQKGKECEKCLNPKTNACDLGNFNTTTAMRDGTTRFSYKGQPIWHYSGISTFSEFTVASEDQVAKVNPSADLEKICLIGCCIGSGYGSVVNIAQVTPGSSCVVWGLGAVGLSTGLGCSAAGAKRIIAIDIQEDKFEFAKKFGFNEFVNPRKLDIPVQEYFQQQGGVDYTFECVGGTQTATLRAAFESLSPWGTCTYLGVTQKGLELSVNPGLFVEGRRACGASFGGYKSREGVQELVEKYVSGELNFDALITGKYKIDDIPHCFDLLRQGKATRSIILYD